HSREGQGLGHESCSRPGATSASEKIQGAVRQPAPQRSDDVHRALPDWTRHLADFRCRPEKKAAIATGTIALAGIPLNRFRRIRAFLSYCCRWRVGLYARPSDNSDPTCETGGVTLQYLAGDSRVRRPVYCSA